MNPTSRQQSTPFSFEMGEQTQVRVRFFNMVYAWMAVGLAVTGVVAWLVSQNETLLRFLYGSKGMIAAFAIGAFLLSWYVQSQALRLSTGIALALFMVYAVLIGAMISYIFLIYDSSTLVGAFFMTGGTFAGVSIYGFVTKRDLSGIGSFLLMAALGLFLASLVNVWLANDAFSWFITYAVLAVFIGITAYETQMLKGIADATSNNSQLASRYAVIGSLVLYISFINMFISILRIMGDRR